MTTEEARALEETLSDAGVEQDPYDRDVWFVRREGGVRVSIGFLPLFPDRVVARVARVSSEGPSAVAGPRPERIHPTGDLQVQGWERWRR